MASLLDFTGITKLRDAWPKWKANIIAVNNQVIAHVAGTADKHAAQDITYIGDFVGKTEVKAALDQAKTEIDTIVVNASIDPEVAFARDSAVKSKVFGSLDDRLEEDEQDLVTYKANMATNVTQYGALADRTTDNTVFVQNTIDDAVLKGWGNVYIPKDVKYTRASIILNSNVLVTDDSGVKRCLSSEPSWDSSNHTKLEVIGHRGLSYLYPEGSAIAFKNSILYKQAHSIECDIRNSIDEELFIFHDFTLERVTNITGTIAEMLASDIRNADLGVKFSPVYAGAKLMYFREACSLVRGLGANFYPQTNVGEITDSVVKERLLRDTINIIISYGIIDITYLQCIGIEVADLIRKINPRIKIALMMGSTAFNTMVEWAKLDRNCIIGTDYQFFIDNPTIAMTARKEGVEIYTYTVDDISLVDKLRKANVYKLMTDINLTGVI